MKMRIHCEVLRDSDYGLASHKYDVSIGSTGFGVVVEIPQWEYDNIEEAIQNYDEVQDKLDKLYNDERNRLHGL